MIDLSQQDRYLDIIWDKHFIFKQMFIQPYNPYIDLIDVRFNTDSLMVRYVPDAGRPTDIDVNCDEFYEFLEMVNEKP